jgi:hypothetical protein
VGEAARRFTTQGVYLIGFIVSENSICREERVSLYARHFSGSSGSSALGSLKPSLAANSDEAAF